MKFKNKYLAVLVITCTFVMGCDDFKFGANFLEKPTEGEMDINKVFSKKIYAEQVLAQVYHTLPDYLPHKNRLTWGMVEGHTDLADVTKSGGTAYHSATLTSSNAEAGIYSMSYDEEHGEGSATYALRLGNIFLENIDRVADMTEDEKNIRKGEAKMIMAFHYVQIFRNLGGMPWIDRSYLQDDDLNFTRMTIEQAVTNTCKLIDEAVAVLPWSVESKDDGRMTKAAGLALKSRLLLFAASPLYNNIEPYKAGEAADKLYVWWGNYDINRWQAALDAGLEFITANKANGFYQLVDTGNPREDFNNGYFTRYNKEVLIAGHRWTIHDINAKAVSQVRYGAGTPTLNYVDMFQMKDGTDFSWDNATHKANPFFNGAGEMVRDPRLYETFIVNQDKFWGREAEIYDGGREGATGVPNWRWGNKGYSGIGIRKLVQDGLNDLQSQYYQCPLLRLPEVYLNIAEAMNELGKATQPDAHGRDAYDYVNLVRARVDMPDLDQARITQGDKLRDAIFRERALEFGYEEIRYYDITRWKKIEWLKIPLRKLHTTKSGSTYTHNVIEGMVNDRIWVDKWDDKYYLVPIPLKEINKKYGLVQNPGW